MSKQIISVVLYGLFGQGKSSIANMFIQGEIRQNDNMFEINDGVVGASATINFSKNDDFMVYDTIGVGETVYGKVPHKEAVRDKKLFYYLSERSLNAEKKILSSLSLIVSRNGEEDDDNDAAVQRRKRTNSLEQFTKELLKNNFKETLNSPIVGSAYQLISSGVHYKLGKTNVAKERLFDVVTGAAAGVACVGVFRVGVKGVTSIILFGLPGHGKSSIANMLIQGDIYHEGNAFEINDSMQSVSATIKSKTNKEFIVYDTIGISETYFGNVPHKEAIQMTRDYFSKCEDSLNYVIYVKKKSRFSEEDHNMFKLFKEIFMGNEKNFLIIITESDQDWVNNNMTILRKHFENYPIIPVDFPCSEDGDDIIQRKIRLVPQFHDGLSQAMIKCPASIRPTAIP
ncbi:10605_t:CDS:2 [Funneliformis geosporum]|nr:10605_t:CDS:2 [Funneliformis geosporum]